MSGDLRHLVLLVCALAWAIPGRANGQHPLDDVGLVCAQAAAHAEREWHLPDGLLAAIGTVESGRRSSPGALAIIWPWTINAEGRGYYQPSLAAAVDLVRSLRTRGIRLIDVGCFQVDLFYHPYAFASLEEAFDPEANARAAARILSFGRLSNVGWDAAIAAYHSASPLLGGLYLRRVHAVWGSIRSRPDPSASFVALLSPQAAQVTVVGPSSPSNRTQDVVQWLHAPLEPLPVVLNSSAGAR